MRYDTIITGGGLSGLISAIELQRKGQRTAIVSGGQSALHFWSGSMELLGECEGRRVEEDPIGHVKHLHETHPYRMIGEERLRCMLEGIPGIFADAGIPLRGSLERNHYRITPLGKFKPAWLTAEDYYMFPSDREMPWKRVGIVNIASYLDFYPGFLSYGFQQRGVECRLHVTDVAQFVALRHSTTEMRATGMARQIDDDAIEELAQRLNALIDDSEVLFMPAILGLFSDKYMKRLREMVDVPLWFVPTIPASVPGTRAQLSLRRRYEQLGGTFLPGDNARRGEIEQGRLRRLYTENLGGMPLEADNFIFATGSFFGHGLIADIEHIYEPVLGLELNDLSRGRTKWYDKDLYAPQPYMKAGVVTDEKFRPRRDGKTIENLYCTGALLDGFNALKEGSGAGITLATALSAVENIVG